MEEGKEYIVKICGIDIPVKRVGEDFYYKAVEPFTVGEYGICDLDFDFEKACYGWDGDLDNLVELEKEIIDCNIEDYVEFITKIMNHIKVLEEKIKLLEGMNNLPKKERFKL